MRENWVYTQVQQLKRRLDSAQASLDATEARAARVPPPPPNPPSTPLLHIQIHAAIFAAASRSGNTFFYSVT